MTDAKATKEVDLMGVVIAGHSGFSLWEERERKDGNDTIYKTELLVLSLFVCDVGKWAVWHRPHQLLRGVKAAPLNAHYVTQGAQ